MFGGLAALVIRSVAAKIQVFGDEVVNEQLAHIRGRYSPRSLLFFHWSEDEVPRLIVAQRLGAGLGKDVSYVTDDTVGGRVGARLLATLGHQTVPLRISRPAQRLRDTRRILCTKGSLSISADGRGPYGTINRGLPQLALRRDAVAVPVSVVASRALRLRRPAPVTLPLPGARLAIAIGSPILPIYREEQDALARFAEGLREARAGSRLILGSEAV